MGTLYQKVRTDFGIIRVCMLKRLHARLGDFWWYSLMIFVACRSGDAIQAFIGLWLVPKYVGAEELGAVLPLQQLSGLFTVPLAVLATVFAKYVNVYATRGEFGKVRCLVRDVLVASAALFAVCIGAAYLVVPFFYERLRVESGLLTILILTAGFVGNISQILTNALQGLKKFNVLSFVNLIGAPIRLVTLLIAMPVRALSGYVLGQVSPPTASSVIAFLNLHRDLRATATDRSWRKDLPDLLRYAVPVTIWTLGCTVYSSFYTTLFRQRLPEVESAAYYLLTKLAEVGGYLGLSLMMVLFPLAAEAHEQGQENRHVLRHAVWGSLLFSGCLALVFAAFGPRLFAFVPAWSPYLSYARFAAPTTIGVGISCAIGSFVTYEMACRRFRPVWIVTSMNLCWLGTLTAILGCEFFRGTLPDRLVNALAALDAANLQTLTWAGLAYTVLQFALVLLASRTAKAT